MIASKKGITIGTIIEAKKKVEAMVEDSVFSPKPSSVMFYPMDFKPELMECKFPPIKMDYPFSAASLIACDFKKKMTPEDFGYKVIESPYCVQTIFEQYRFPKSKKKRVKKKWRKRTENFRIKEYDYRSFLLESEKTFIVPPGYKNKIIEALNEK